ncbi:MAG TPA: response regulator transcription factor [Bryobacteraceae bacterium]|nr:response regulator transcription factor [Bryobacteraceae bacterium]
MIRVAVQVAGPALRVGLEAMLRGAGFDVVSADADPDVIVADSADGGEAGPPIVLVGVEQDSPPSIERGIRALLPGNCTGEELAAAVQAVAAGLIAYPAAYAAALLEATSAVEPAPTGVLSPRELEVLQLMAEGLANKEIAWRMGISEHTVKFHVASILNRLDAASRTQAVSIGVRRGLLML